MAEAVRSNKVTTLDDVVDLIPQGARLGVGGVILQRKPVALLDSAVHAGIGTLQLHSFLASLDVELLAAHGALAEAHTGYVGFEQLGFAPAYEAAVQRGHVTAYEYSEFLFVAGLRAAMAGLPFFPAKGGAGSQLLDELCFKSVRCPYTDEEILAVPAKHLDVALLHAEAASPSGHVMGPASRDFLFDLDANIARAADVVIVSVERIVSEDEIIAARERTLLFNFEVDAVVEAPHGAAPTALPGSYTPDFGALRRYLVDAATDPADVAGAMRTLTRPTQEVSA